MMDARSTREIAVILVDRANYGRLKPLMAELQSRPEVHLNVICAGTMLLDRFGRAADLVRADGFEVAEEVYIEVEGSLPTTMAKSIGLGVIEFATALQRMKPDFALVIGDRYEAMAATIAAAYQNICLIHVQGGEVSGSIDESTRHAITKFSHFHFPATARSAEYLVAMGEEPSTVYMMGCPGADVVSRALDAVPADEMHRLGVGPQVDFTRPYLLVVFHPVTTEYSSAELQMEELLAAVKMTGMQTVLLWPNIDAGSDGVSQAIRRFRENNRDVPLHAYKNFEPEVYIPLLGRAACAVGNSSSFVRDASYVGTPVVLVGSRQDGREWAPGVRRVEPKTNDILEAIRDQVAHGPYDPSDLYGSTGSCARIADRIMELTPYSQKRLAYVGL